MSEALARVEALLREALEMLDGVGARADIGAHIDLALDKLKDAQAELKRQADRDGF